MKGTKKSLIKLALFTAGTLHIINKIIDSSAINKMTFKTGGKIYHWKQGDIYYRVSGDGEPILLIHDLDPISSSYEWTRIEKALAKDHTVYCLDLLGCGKSDKPPILYTNYIYVQLVNDFIKEVVGEPVKAVTSGLSCSFALMANHANPSLFYDLTLISPVPTGKLKVYPDQKAKILPWFFQTPIIGTFVYYMIMSKVNIEYQVTEKFFYNPFHVNESIVKAFYDASHAQNGKGKYLFASVESNYLNIDVSNAVKNAKNKIHLILGEKTENYDEIVQSYRKLNPDISGEIIPNAKKLPQLETPEEVLRALKATF